MDLPRETPEGETATAESACHAPASEELKHNVGWEQPAAIYNTNVIQRYFVDLTPRGEEGLSRTLLADGWSVLQPMMGSGDKPTEESTFYKLVRSKLIGLAHGTSQLVQLQPRMNSSCAPVRDAVMNDEQVVDALIAVHHYGGASAWLQTYTEPHSQPKYVQKFLKQTQAVVVQVAMRSGDATTSLQWMLSRAGQLI